MEEFLLPLEFGFDSAVSGKERGGREGEMVGEGGERERERRFQARP